MAHNNDSALKAQITVYLILTVVLIFSKVACSTSIPTKANAVEALERDGYTDVETTGFRWFTCGETFRATGFTATSPSGITDTTGAVCCGAVVRGCSIRTD